MTDPLFGSTAPAPEHSTPPAKPKDATTSTDTTHGSTTTSSDADKQGAFTKLVNDSHVDGGHDDGYQDHSDAFRQGLSQPPSDLSQANQQARNADQDAARGEGQSRGQIVSYTDSSGGQVTGGQYTKADGTYLKTTEGDTYKVQSGQNGGYTLEPTKPGQEPISASNVQVMSNSFGGGRNNEFGGQQPDGGTTRSNPATPVDATAGTPPKVLPGQNAPADAPVTTPAKVSPGQNAPADAPVTTPKVAPGQNAPADAPVTPAKVSPGQSAPSDAPATTPKVAGQNAPSDAPATTPKVAGQNAPSDAPVTTPAKVSPGQSAPADAPVTTPKPNPTTAPPVDNSHVGNQNVGNQNVGNQNVGNQNVGNQNVGNQNVGNQNVGNQNVGNQNVGNQNPGNQNLEHNQNVGNQNIGNQNIAANNQNIQANQFKQQPGAGAGSDSGSGAVKPLHQGDGTTGANTANPVTANPISFNPATNPGDKTGQPGGLQQGLQPGLQQGLQQGLQPGLQQGLQGAIAANLGEKGLQGGPNQGLPGQQALDRGLLPGGINATNPGGDRSGLLPGQMIGPDGKPLPPGQGGVLGNAGALDASKVGLTGAMLGPDGKPLPPGHLPLDASQLAQKGQLNPADFIKGADGKAQQVQDAGIKGAVGDQNPHNQALLAGLKDGSDPARMANPALRTMIPGFDLTDGQNRQLAGDILKQIQATKAGGAEFTLQNFQDLTKGMDANRIDKLQGFLFPDGKNQLNDQAAGRLTGLLTIPGALDAQSRAFHLDNLNFMSKGKEITDLTAQPKDGRATMQEIGKVMQDTNRLLTMDGKDALTLAQLISKSVDTNATKAGAEKMLEGKGPLDRALGEKPDPANFAVKTQGVNDLLVKMLNDKSNMVEATKGSLTVPQAMATLEGRTTQQTNAEAAARAHAADKSDTVKTEAPKDKDGEQKVNLTANTKEQDEKTKPQEKKEEEAKKDNRKEMEEQVRQDALLALMAERKAKEAKEKAEKEKEKQQQVKKDEETRRRRYIVKDGDTLESIAAKQMKDAKLAPLIYDINRSVIQAKRVDGKDSVDLKAGLMIWLPSTADIAKFRKEGAKNMDEQVSADEELRTRFGNGWDGTVAGAGNGGTRAGLANSSNVTDEERRQNIEKMLGSVSKKPEDPRLKYVVRLGDSLKSIAMKHPALQDLALWRLLAQVNEMEETTDDKGVPAAKPGRGAVLIIPDNEQIEKYCAEHKIKRRLTIQPKPCESCNAPNLPTATICSACGHVFALSIRAPRLAATSSGAEVLEKEALHDPDAELISLARLQKLYSPETELAVTPLDEQSRLIRCRLAEESQALVVSVEILHLGIWQAVIAYEIHPTHSMRYEFTPDGNRRSVRIDIPTESAMTLSNNDLSSNWKNYRDRYFAQTLSLKH